MNRREALAALVSLPVATRISVAKLKPDDVIVMECDQHLTIEQCGRIQEQMEGLWPGHRCAVLTKGLTLKVVQG